MLRAGVFISAASAVAAASCSVSVFPKLSCGLTYTTEEACNAAGCCFDTSAGSAETACFIPNVEGYALQLDSSSSSAVHLTGRLSLRGSSGLFARAGSTDEASLVFDAVQETVARTHIKISSAEKKLWEVPESLLPRPGGSVGAADDALTDMFAGASSSGQFEFSVSRKGVSSEKPIFSIADNLIFQEQYLQLVVPVPADVSATFGMGESTRARQTIGANETRTLWNTDISAATFDVDLYGAHPFVLQLSSDGQASGYFLLSSNALEASMQTRGDGTGGAAMGIQAAGGILDLYIFAGPTPAEVIRQYQEVVGLPAMVPYWSLGFHNCEWGYPNLDYVKDVVANYSAAGIPLETQWMDIDYMDAFLDFTTSPVNFPQQQVADFIDSLHHNGQRFVPIVDPGIYALDPTYDAYVSGLEQNVFIKDLNGVDNFIGQVWPGPTVFPDFLATNSTSYWTNQLRQFHEIVPFDGIWIDMNEVSNFCNDGTIQTCELDAACPNGCCVACSTPDQTNRYDFSPWVPHVYHGALGGKTLPMSALHQGGELEYNVHNLYGFSESIATNAALTAITGERPFLLSRSTFAGSGKHTAHWTGDNAATWEDLAASIVTMNSMATFGVPMVGADICGFIADTTEELCARWIAVGAFSPFSRDHNEIGAAPQELYRWDSVAEASRNALGLRYQLLPHLYTLMYRAHTDGYTVHNALWVHFPEDQTTISCDSQYMWSDSLLFTPVLSEGAGNVTGYFPRGLWYPLPVGFTPMSDVIDASAGGMAVTLDTPLNSTNVHVRGGSIVPMQQGGLTTTASRNTPYSLVVALDAEHKASGSLFIDDGVQTEMEKISLLEFTFEEGVFVSRVVKSDYKPASGAMLNSLTIKGLKDDITACRALSVEVTGLLDGRSVRFDEVLALSAHELKISSTVGISILENFKIHVEC